MRQSALIIFWLMLSLPASTAGPVQTSNLKGWQGPKPPKPPCECRAPDGSKSTLGDTMCLRRGDSVVTVQCRLVLNNTIWKEVEKGCEIPMN